MNCKICNNELGPKGKFICTKCNNVKHAIKCIECSIEYKVTAHHFIKVDKNIYVCKSCKSCKLKGHKNPNFGKKWNEEMKIKQSNIIKSKVDDEYRLNCAKGMKGKAVSDTTIKKQLETKIQRYGTLTTNTGHTEETKKLIGEKSSKKFTKEYKLKQRLYNEEKGYWIPLKDKDNYALYRELSNWSVNVITENMNGVELLKKYKLKSKTNNNANSLVRDHMYGRKNGFVNGVFPEIIRHPANCQLLKHSDNIKKAKYNNDSIITLDELFNKIVNWNIDYIEQALCLKLIDKYKNGLRYDKSNYINKYYEQLKN